MKKFLLIMGAFCLAFTLSAQDEGKVTLFSNMTGESLGESTLSLLRAGEKVNQISLSVNESEIMIFTEISTTEKECGCKKYEGTWLDTSETPPLNQLLKFKDRSCCQHKFKNIWEGFIANQEGRQLDFEVLPAGTPMLKLTGAPSKI